MTDKLSDAPFARGDIVETIKGAKFWGEVVSVYDLGAPRFDGEPSGWRCDVRAIDPGFDGTIHVYPAVQLQARAAKTAGDRDDRQRQVAEWCAAAFGIEHQSSVPQRGLRMLEEAIEAYQALNGDPAQAHALIDYIFAKEPGQLFQELGGLSLTLLALAAAAGVSADEAERTEIARVMAKPLAWFHARNEVKNKAGFDATAYPTEAPSTLTNEANDENHSRQ